MGEWAVAFANRSVWGTRGDAILRELFSFSSHYCKADWRQDKRRDHDSDGSVKGPEDRGQGSRIKGSTRDLTGSHCLYVYFEGQIGIPTFGRSSPIFGRHLPLVLFTRLTSAIFGRFIRNVSESKNQVVKNSEIPRRMEG